MVTPTEVPAFPELLVTDRDLLDGQAADELIGYQHTPAPVAFTPGPVCAVCQTPAVGYLHWSVNLLTHPAVTWAGPVELTDGNTLPVPGLRQLVGRIPICAGVGCWGYCAREWSAHGDYVYTSGCPAPRLSGQLPLTTRLVAEETDHQGDQNDEPEGEVEQPARSEDHPEHDGQGQGEDGQAPQQQSTGAGDDGKHNTTSPTGSHASTAHEEEK